MNEKQFKQQSLDLAANIATALGNIGFGLNLKDDDLAKTQKLVKKFDETLTEFIDSRKPKFEIGDYVIEQGGDAISKIDKVDDDGDFMGLYYKRTVNFFSHYRSVIFRKDIERHATPEEISEYKTALNFHKHGRKPFEVKAGDMVKIPSGGKQIVAYAEVLTKPDFANGWELLKTAEELEEWLR